MDEDSEIPSKSPGGRAGGPGAQERAVRVLLEAATPYQGGGGQFQEGGDFTRNGAQGEGRQVSQRKQKEQGLRNLCLLPAFVSLLTGNGVIKKPPPEVF